MFWWAVSPFWIACVMTPMVLVAAFLISYKRGSHAVIAAIIALAFTAFAFIPLCVVAYAALTPFRFGEFHAETFDSVRFPYVQDYLPKAADDITMVNTAHDHHTRFTIDADDLNDWMDSLWNKHGKRSPMTRDEAAFAEKTVYDDDDLTLRRLGLATGRSYLRYEGPYQGDWGGPTLWYDPESKTAWQRVGYW